MRDHALESNLVERFGITHTEARKMVDEAEAKAAVRKAVVAASRGHAVEAKPDVDFEQPAVWRHEVHRRLAALDVMEEGIGCLRALQKHIKAVIEAEEQLVQHKRAKVRDKHVDWWDLRDSGWAMGGRERFATYVGDIFRNLDEGQLGGKVMDRMGFKRSIPLPDIPEPVIESAPRDADELVAALVNGAKGRKRVKAAQDRSVLAATLQSAIKRSGIGIHRRVSGPEDFKGFVSVVTLGDPKIRFILDENPRQAGQYNLQIVLDDRKNVFDKLLSFPGVVSAIKEQTRKLLQEPPRRIAPLDEHKWTEEYWQQGKS